MPILSISKIQHRYGLSENLPQLSAAELGWAIDTRRLYIGNGPTSEGAPQVGNTEVLTQYSDLLALASTYTYKGDAGGYTVQTGANANSPVSRTLQQKFDDEASVKDFGAVGNGVTDDTAAINRAFFEIFCRDSNPETRRSLFFPAGNYIVSDEIMIPTYAMVRGEGQHCTFITQTNSSASCVARTADSKQQIDANIGNNGATLPSFISVNDITFVQTKNNDVFIINSGSDIRFQRAEFTGNITNPTNTGDTTSCVTIYSTAVNHSSHIVFEQCLFNNNIFGVVIDDDVDSLLFDSCKFTTLYKGLKLGENTTGSGSAVIGPHSVSVTNSLFDRIYSTGIHVYGVSGIHSTFNYYADVGNHYIGIATDNVILYAHSGNSSIMDTFDRTDADDVTVPRINMFGGPNYVASANKGLRVGRHNIRLADQISLADNTVSATSTGITFSATAEKGVKIYYTASRGTYFRHGELIITATSNNVSLSDEFQEDGDIGLTFSVTVVGSVTTLKFVTTNTGNAVTFTYGVELMNY